MDTGNTMSKFLSANESGRTGSICGLRTRKEDSLDLSDNRKFTCEQCSSPSTTLVKLIFTSLASLQSARTRARLAKR